MKVVEISRKNRFICGRPLSIGSDELGMELECFYFFVKLYRMLRPKFHQISRYWCKYTIRVSHLARDLHSAIHRLNSLKSEPKNSFLYLSDKMNERDFSGGNPLRPTNGSLAFP
jgi:hypothetical protein